MKISELKKNESLYCESFLVNYGYQNIIGGKNKENNKRFSLDDPSFSGKTYPTKKKRNYVFDTEIYFITRSAEHYNTGRRSLTKK